MARGNRPLLILLVVLFAAFVYVVWGGMEVHIAEVGDKAPKFAITSESGQRITQSEFGGKLLVLNFWATWCPPCVEEMPSLNQFATQMGPQGVTVLGVSIDKSERAYRTFLQSNRLGFQVARDPEENISSSYGTFKWPETYVIDRSGKIVMKFIGPRDWTDPQIVNAVRGLL